MSGDEYLIATNVFYPILWIGALIFLLAYFFTSIRNVYECFHQSKRRDKWQLWNIFRKVHAIMVATIYNSLYIAIFGLIGYIIGTMVLDNVPQVKEIFMAVVHIPVLEYVLKGIPLAVGSLVGNFLTSWCVDVQC
jgi:hypothetical protein